MSENTIIKSALSYYDQNNSKYTDLFDKIKMTKIKSNTKDMSKSKIFFYDNNNKLFMKGDYEIAGNFYNKYKLWIWSWAIPVLVKNKTLLSRKILNYGLDIDSSNKPAINFFIKSELTTSRFKINKLQLDIHIALISYICKEPIIYPYIDYLSDTDKDNYVIWYMFILNLEVIN